VTSVRFPVMSDTLRIIRTLSSVALLSLACNGTAFGQAASAPPEQEAVLSVVDSFMTAISTNDFALMSRLRIEGGTNTVERPATAGGTLVTRRPFSPDGQKPGEYRERYWDPVVHVRGKLAVVWTPYEFWQGGKTSHCGIDVFELVREDSGWRIANMMWTVEPEACPALRPSDPLRVRPRQ
jgi:hypothetical protein